MSYDNGDIQWYGVTQDITERKRAEETLLESEEKFRSLADTAKVVISIVADTLGAKFLYVNNEWSRVYGYSKEEAQNLRPIDLVSAGIKTENSGSCSKTPSKENQLHIVMN